MLSKKLFFCMLYICIAACNNHGQTEIKTSEEISKSIHDATINAIPFEGKFVKIEKINERNYYLFLKGDSDSITTFITGMPLDEHEINLLKKEGNNIKLAYKDFYNPVKKRTDKIVKYMQPVYDPGK